MGCIPAKLVQQQCPGDMGGVPGPEWPRWLECQVEELTCCPKGNREPWQHLDVERGVVWAQVGEAEAGMVAWAAQSGGVHLASFLSTCPETTQLGLLESPHLLKAQLRQSRRLLGAPPDHWRLRLQPLPAVAAVSSL